jgi:hypothetical protein
MVERNQSNKSIERRSEEIKRARTTACVRRRKVSRAGRVVARASDASSRARTGPRARIADISERATSESGLDWARVPRFPFSRLDSSTRRFAGTTDARKEMRCFRYKARVLRRRRVLMWCALVSGVTIWDDATRTF